MKGSGLRALGTVTSVLQNLALGQPGYDASNSKQASLRQEHMAQVKQQGGSESEERGFAGDAVVVPKKQSQGLAGAISRPENYFIPGDLL